MLLQHERACQNLENKILSSVDASENWPRTLPQLVDGRACRFSSDIKQDADWLRVVIGHIRSEDEDGN